MARKKTSEDPGEFLWLISLSDLMILLFIFFVTLYAFAYQKLNQSDYNQIMEAFGNQKVDNPIERVQEDVNKWIEENNLGDQIEVVKVNGEVHIQMKDKVLFTSGKYELMPAGFKVMKALAKALDKIPPPYKLGIDGHTDDVPMRSRKITNNRELSAKRAMAVYNALNFSEGTAKRTTITAHGANKPLAPNRDEKTGKPIAKNQARNRRVTIRIY